MIYPMVRETNCLGSTFFHDRRPFADDAVIVKRPIPPRALFNDTTVMPVSFQEQSV